jgi:hypothetical protein
LNITADCWLKKQRSRRSDSSSEPYWMRTGFAATCATAVCFFATGVINPAMMP